MTVEIGFLIGLLVVMAYLFFTERLPIEITAFSGLLLLVFLGFIPTDKAFEGFSSPAVITMLSIFFLSAALQQTGVADYTGHKIYAVCGNREVPLMIAVMGVAALLSSVMNNVAATAVLLPAVASLARSSGVSPGRLFMPLSFGAVLGGTVTLVGTPPNIILADMMAQRGQLRLGFFELTPYGLILVAAGILYMVTIGRHMLPQRESTGSVSRQSDLIQIYRLHSTLFSIRVPQGSGLDGSQLRHTTLRAALGVEVVGIVRGDRRRLAPEPDTILLAGDVLLVKGKASDVRELYRMQGSEFVEAVPEELAGASERVAGVVARLAEKSPLVGQTLRALNFRGRFGAIVIALRRDGHVIDTAIAGEPLRAGDELLALGTRAQLQEVEIQQHFEVSPMGPEVFRSLRGHLYVLSVPESSDLVGTTIGESRMGELVGLTISGILRGDDTLLGLEPEERILTGDRLLVTGSQERIKKLLELGDVDLQQDVAEESLTAEGIGVVEATVAPRSSSAGKTLAEIRFREKYGVQVLAVWRDGELIHTQLAELKLRFGDALLMQGPWDRIRLLAEEPDFLVLSSTVSPPKSTRKAPLALGGLALMVGMILTGLQPVHVAAFAAATFVVLTRVITMEQAYRAVEWRVVFLIAAILPVGGAVESTGAATLLSQMVTDLAGPAGPYVVLAALAALSSMLSQTLDGSPAVVLLTPVAISVAEVMGVSPRPMMLGVGLAASAAFMTPFSHKAHLLVMGAGGYKMWDYLKVGTPLTLLTLGLIVLLVPWLTPF
ncbi:MAG: SLC13 family permease [Gemmatimonadetes bacterium]|nr:SLC13 family permease [Gemmatimonadota bacterium]